MDRQPFLPDRSGPVSEEPEHLIDLVQPERRLALFQVKDKAEA